MQNISANRKLDLLTLMHSWMSVIADVIDKARNQLQFDSECHPELLARHSLLECSDAIEKLDDIDVDRAVGIFHTKWNEKVSQLAIFCCF